MNVARRSDGLLTARQTLALLTLVDSRGDGCGEEQALADLAATEPVSWSKARNTIVMLRRLKTLGGPSGTLSLIAGRGFGREEWFERLGSLVAGVIVEKLASEQGASLRAHPTDGLTLDSFLLSGAEDGLSSWILEFSIASRPTAQSRFWQVDPRYEGAFLASARVANTRRPRRAISIEALDAQLAANAEHGKAAEEWVLAFECRRLQAHPLVDQIRRVSESDVAAGYDIISFSTAAAMHHDLHIEVKSYAGTRRFFWSRNEIATAEEFGEEYALYLVDRTMIWRSDYTPQIIQAPTAAMFAAEGSGWNVAATTFEHVAIERASLSSDSVLGPSE